MPTSVVALPLPSHCWSGPACAPLQLAMVATVREIDDQPDGQPDHKADNCDAGQADDQEEGGQRRQDGERCAAAWWP